MFGWSACLAYSHLFLGLVSLSPLRLSVEQMAGIAHGCSTPAGSSALCSVLAVATCKVGTRAWAEGDGMKDGTWTCTWTTA